MKSIDYIIGAAIQSLLVTPLAYVFSRHFFESPISIAGVTIAFFVILLGYLIAMALLRRLPLAIRANLIVMLAVGGVVGTLTSVLFLSLHFIFNMYSEIPARTAVGFVYLTAAAASIVTWLMRKIT